MQTNAGESDQANFFNLINKYDLFARTLRSFMFNKPPRVKSRFKIRYMAIIFNRFKVRLLGKKNIAKLLRVIGLNIADDLEDNINNHILRIDFQAKLLLEQTLAQDRQGQY